MKNDVFGISKDFVLSKLVESIYIDVKYEGYDLQIIVEYEMKNGKITTYDVWTTAPNYCVRFYAWGGDNRTTPCKDETIEEVIELVYDNFKFDNISFDEIIECIEENEQNLL